MRWECIPINRMLLKLEFIGAKPSQEEIAALEVVLQRLFFTQGNGVVNLNPWRLAERFPDAALEDLRRSQSAALATCIR